MKNENRNQRKGFEVPEKVKKLAKLNPKKFKKKNKDLYDSKKELKRAYYDTMLDFVPACIEAYVRYGHISEMQEFKEMVYQKFSDRYFIKMVKKIIEDGDTIDNIELFPIIVYEIIGEAQKQYEMEKKEHPETASPYDVSDLIELSQLILKKKLKKMKKNDIPESLAFDILSVIPDESVMKYSQAYRIRMLFTVLYEHAKTEEIPFDKIMKVLLDEEYYPMVISFAMLERKEKYAQFNDGQKAFFNQVSEWVFNTLEDMDKDTIYNVIKTYVNARKKDDSQGKDAVRRFYLSSLPESDYPKINKAMQKMLSVDENNKKYF